MNNTRALEVSIQAVSPELIFDESTENGAVGAAGAVTAVATEVCVSACANNQKVRKTNDRHSIA